MRLLLPEKHRKKILLISAAAVFAIIIIIAGIQIVRHLKEPILPAENAIPGNTAWYLRLNDVTAIVKTIKAPNGIGEELSKHEYFSSRLGFLSSMAGIVEHDQDVSALFGSGPLYICCTYPENKNAEILVLCNLPNAHQSEKINRIFSKYAGNSYAVKAREHNRTAYSQAGNAEGKAFFFATTQGIFLYSTSEEFLVSAISQSGTDQALASDPGFKEVRASSGTHVDGNLFINLHLLGNIFNKEIIAGSHLSGIDFLASAGNWAGFDLTLRNDEILLNGYIRADSTEFLGRVLKESAPQKTALTRFIPFNTALMLYIGVDDLSTYTANLRYYLNAGDHKTHGYLNDEISRRCQCDVPDNFRSWAGNEAALVITESKNKDWKDHTFGVIRTKNKEAARENLQRLAASVQDADDAEQQDSLDIMPLKYSNILHALFGGVFSGLESNCCVILGDYVIFGNSPQALRLFSAAILSKKTLDKNENYAAFAGNVSDEASLCLYVNIRKSDDIIRNIFAGNIKKEITLYASKVRNFQAFAAQVVPDGNMFYTNIYLKYNPFYHEENPAVWEVELDTFAAGPPFLLADHADQSRQVVIFDEMNQMYMIDNLGRILWKRQLQEKPLSDVYTIEFPRNGKSRLLFNTARHLWMLDMNGENIPGFPLRLSYEATNGLAIFDYDNNRKYRILIAGDDGKIYNYTADGKAVSGWLKPSLSTTITEPLSHIRMLGKDYLIAPDKTGKSHFFDRRGRKMSGKGTAGATKSKSSAYYIFADGSRSRIITPDRAGRIIRFAPDGSTELVKFGSFTPRHKFLYEDFNGDAIKDFIFCDSNLIRVYNVNKKLIFKCVLPGVAGSSLIKVRSGKRTPVFGVVMPDTSRVFLFSKNGPLPVNPYLEGSGEARAGFLDKGGVPALIVSHGKKVYHYLLNEN